jgi:hypothetical protein
MLSAALHAVGFSRVESCSYGESETPELTNLERHEKWEDTPELPHVLIVEASGVAPPVPLPPEQMKEFREAIGAR